MPLYQVFCESCSADYSIQIHDQPDNKLPKFCGCCGTELDANSILEQKLEKVTDDWDDYDESLDSDGDWQWNER